MRYVIVGLGNPETKYKNTRHNIGFEVIDEIGRILNVEIKKNRFSSLFAEVVYSNCKLYLLKPKTYMNLSGIAIAEIKNFYKINVSNLIVIHDEMDLPLGKLKVKQGGGTAGHNGIKSIVNSIGDNGFTHIKIGIGRPLNKNDGQNYVLSKFSKTEKETINNIIIKASETTLNIISSSEFDNN